MIVLTTGVLFFVRSKYIICAPDVFNKATWRKFVALVECGCNETLSPRRLRGVDKPYVNMDVFETGQTNILIDKVKWNRM
jgi:hypothetical protein